MGFFDFIVPGELDAFRFLPESIRESDRTDGQEFLRRYYLGIQQIWETIRSKILSVQDLWDVVNCPDKFLPYLKNIVGWTKQFARITDELDADTLRRLISVSAAMWKGRTTEDTYVDVLNLLVPGRARVWNWFWFRIITDETYLGEERQGRDPWMISFPGSGQEYYSNLRLVDPGSANKQLVRDVLRLLRPINERIEIIYLKFLDLFEIDEDLTQWDIGKAINAEVAGGFLSLVGNRHAIANAEGSEDWENYVAFTRIRGGQSSGAGFGLSFYVTTGAFDNYYYARIDVEDNELQLRKVVGGIHSSIATFSFSSSYLLQNDIWYGLRVQVSPDGSTNRIKVYLDGTERINTTDASHSRGSAGIFSGANSYAQADELEVMGLPVDSETIDINS